MVESRSGFVVWVVGAAVLVSAIVLLVGGSPWLLLAVPPVLVLALVTGLKGRPHVLELTTIALVERRGRAVRRVLLGHLTRISASAGYKESPVVSVSDPSATVHVSLKSADGQLFVHALAREVNERGLRHVLTGELALALFDPYREPHRMPPGSFPWF